jgi:diguanylate cyclase (GGDEF)-like protein
MYLWRRQAPLRIARNIALQLCAVASVLLFSRLALPPTMTPGGMTVIVAILGACWSGVLTTALVYVSLRLIGVPSARPLLRANLVTALLTGLMQAFLALLGVTLLFHDGRSGAILAVVALVLCACYRAYTLLRERADATELLFGYTSAAGPVISEDQLVATVAAHACEMMHTQHAEVWLAEGGPDGTYRVAHVGNEAAPVLTTRQALSWDVVSRVVEAGEPLLIRRRTRSPELQRLLRVHQMRDLVATAVRVDGAIVGVIVVGDRRGDLRTFRDVDVRLLEALASHTAAIVQNVRLFERLRFDSLHDALTGLPNRVAFQQAAIAATEARPTEPVAVLILDVNSFTQINDTLGHESGDSLLCEVGRRLRAALAAEATVARLGADEFGVLLPSPRDSDDVLLTARLILRALEVPYQVDGVLLELGASIGAAVSPEHADNGTLLLQRADSSMYAAKRDATGVELYSSDRDDNSQRRLGMATELRRAIERDELLVYYQPKVSLRTGRVVGAEALARWIHPQHGFVPPDEFIPIAEQTGLIRPLTDHILRAALEQCAAWRASGHDVGVAVNLSVRSLVDLDLPETVRRMLQETGVPAESLTLEVTESSVMSDPDRIIAILTRLDELHVRLSVDDFGTGYSSLSYLQRLPVREVKIDRSFVMSLGQRDSDLAIVRTIVDLGSNLGLTVVAEGVEDAEAYNRLAELGCDLAQGYLLSRPLPAAAFVEWLEVHDVTVVAPLVSNG